MEEADEAFEISVSVSEPVPEAFSSELEEVPRGRGGGGEVEHLPSPSPSLADDTPLDLIRSTDEMLEKEQEPYHHYEEQEEYEEATWKKVLTSCCCHTPKEWIVIFVAAIGVCALFYFFLLGLELMVSGAQVASGCKAGELLGSDVNPVTSLMTGILITAVVQSSSTTTAVIISLVGEVISLQQGIYMLMGANFGTTITNTMVSFAQVDDGDQLERAFAGATLHDMFNFMTVAILLPLEVVSGFLNTLAGAIVKSAIPESVEEWEGPVNMIVSPLRRRLIIANKQVVVDVAAGDAKCEELYPMNCTSGVTPTYESCHGQFGLIACDEESGFCPVFFQPDATERNDKFSGGVVLFIGIIILFVCLLCIVAIVQRMLVGTSARVLNKVNSMNGYLVIVIGAGVTMLVQSSSVTTSTLTPMVGIGVLDLEQMYPFTLGANIGTAAIGLVAASAREGTAPMQVAIANIFFNAVGVLLFYPIPYTRRIPLNAARQLGRAAFIWRVFPFLYTGVVFFLVPIICLGLSMLFDENDKGSHALAAILSAILVFACIWVVYWCQFNGGQGRCANCMAQRERRRLALEVLPDELENLRYLRYQVDGLIKHTALPPERPDDGHDTDEIETDEEEGDPADQFHSGFTTQISVAEQFHSELTPTSAAEQEEPAEQFHSELTTRISGAEQFHSELTPISAAEQFHSEFTTQISEHNSSEGDLQH